MLDCVLKKLNSTMKKVEKKKNKTSTNKYLRLFWAIFVGGVGFIALIFALANFGVFGDMPTFDELENPNSSLATEIISADGKTIGKFYQIGRASCRERV